MLLLTCATGSGCEYSGKISPEQRQKHSVSFPFPLCYFLPPFLSLFPFNSLPLYFPLSCLISLGHFTFSIPQGQRQTHCTLIEKPHNRLLSVWALPGSHYLSVLMSQFWAMSFFIRQCSGIRPVTGSLEFCYGTIFGAAVGLSGFYLAEPLNLSVAVWQ